MHNAHVIDFYHWRWFMAFRLKNFWQQAVIAEWHMQELRIAEAELRK